MQWYKIEFLNKEDSHGLLYGEIQAIIIKLIETMMPNIDDIAVYTKVSGHTRMEVADDLMNKDKTYYLCLPDQLSSSLILLFRKYHPESCDKPHAKDVRFLLGHDDPNRLE